MERRNNASRVEATKAGIFDSIKLSKFAYAILLFDNLGFKNRQGWRKGLGYEQFTILKVVIIDEKELKKSGLYNSNSELELNRKWHNWEEIRSQPESSFESIVKPNDNDTELFAGVVLDIIKGIIKSEVDGVFPSLTECKNLLKTKAYKNGGKPRVWKGDAYYGYNVDSHQNDDELDSEKVIYDVPMHEDLNKNSTVLEILEYVREINEFIINNGEETEGFEHFRPILHDARISMAGDGSPIISAQNIMKKNDNLRNKVTAVFGGFHLMLELYKKRGKLFEETHLRNMFATTQESTKAQDFVLQPSDPNQVEKESIKIHTAVYLSALRSLVYIKRNKLDIDEIFAKDFEDVIDDSDDETWCESDDNVTGSAADDDDDNDLEGDNEEEDGAGIIAELLQEDRGHSNEMVGIATAQLNSININSDATCSCHTLTSVDEGVGLDEGE